MQYGVIGIDEGQFVSRLSFVNATIANVNTFQFPDLIEFCEEMADSGKTVIVAALDGTFQRKVHDASFRLLYLFITSFSCSHLVQC